MPRQIRIEYPGALYHAMSRGNDGQPIFLDDRDREVFLKTLGEVCVQTGWRIHAFVLMGNHYHLLLETPEPNLVGGMKWFQGTFTQRFNARHRRRGHLYQGRYKALLVEGRDPYYFQMVSSYIHLNPARAGLLDPSRPDLADYVWSSYPLYLAAARPEWLVAATVLAAYGGEDTGKGIKIYRRHIQRRVEEIVLKGHIVREWDALRRGWCLGSEDFRSGLLEKVDAVLSGKKPDSHSGAPVHLHTEARAADILAACLGRLKMSEEELRGMRKGAMEKRLIGWMIRRQTRVPNEWIARRIGMGSPSNLSKHWAWAEAAGDASAVRLRQELMTAIEDGSPAETTKNED